MPIFRKKPVEVEAIQWNGESSTLAEINALANGGQEIAVTGEGGLLIETLEGDMVASGGDWIIRGTAGELYPCKPDIFAGIYEPVTIGRTELGGTA